MKTLFYVSAYNHRLNEWARFLVTSTDADEAEAYVRESVSSEWSQYCSRNICQTTDDVWTEL